MPETLERIEVILMGTMTVTSRAVEQLTKLLEKDGNKDQGLRIAVRAGGCAGYRYFMTFEGKPTKSDEVIESNGVRIFIDKESRGYLRGAELDYVESLEGSYFNINNPNAHSACSCGKSFKP